jgi:hypothetical protein
MTGRNLRFLMTGLKFETLNDMVNYEIPGNMVKFKTLDDMVEYGILITE